MIVIVDSNIIISAVINSSGNEYSILQQRHKKVDFISSSLLVEEFAKRIKDIASLTANSVSDVRKVFESITDSFLLIDIADLDQDSLTRTDLLIKNLDINDYQFLAITICFDALFWTGDLKLYRGLRRKGFNNVVITKELREIIKGLNR